MNAFVFQGALLCVDCAEITKAEAWRSLGDLRESNPELLETSDCYPQGPYSDGGGEADCPEHCDHCGAFLENPLTTDGEAYVRRAVLANGRIAREVWAPFYAYLFPAAEEEEEPRCDALGCGQVATNGQHQWLYCPKHYARLVADEAQES